MTMCNVLTTEATVCRVDSVMKCRIDFNYYCGRAALFAVEISRGFQLERLLD